VPWKEVTNEVDLRGLGVVDTSEVIISVYSSRDRFGDRWLFGEAVDSGGVGLLLS
jgi:hypothetical protein